MRMLQLLVCLYISYGTLAAAPTPNPLVCDSNGTLTYTYTGRHDWVKTAVSDCGNASVNFATDAVIVKGCGLGNTANVTLYSMNSTHTPMSIVKSKDAKENVIVLKCNPASDGATYTAKVQFPGSVTPTSFTANENIELSMTITGRNDTKTPSKVVIGDKYLLHISGAGNHHMKLDNCKADITDTFTAKSVTVYNSVGTDHLGIIELTVPTPTPAPKPGTLVVTMTGFRLVGSTSVYLQCTVEICDEPGCTGTKRKRTKPSIRTAGVHFEVLGTQTRLSANSAMEMYAAWKLTVTFAIVAVANYFTL